MRAPSLSHEISHRLSFCRVPKGADRRLVDRRDKLLRGMRRSLQIALALVALLNLPLPPGHCPACADALPVPQCKGVPAASAAAARLRRQQAVVRDGL